MLLAAPALAASVAVLELDGRGVRREDVETATQGVRDAFLEDGRLDPLSGSDIADGVSGGHDGELRRARELAAQARAAHDGGDPARAIPALTEAIRLHEVALSDIGRRPELADAHVLLALCLVKVGRSGEAREQFRSAELLYPGYRTDRGGRLPPSAVGLLAGVADELAEEASPLRGADEVEAVRAALNVDYVVVGTLDSGGEVRAAIWGEERHGEVRVRVPVPPPPADDAYGHVASALADAALSPSPGARTSVAPRVPVADPDEEEGLEDEEELDPDFDEPPPRGAEPRRPVEVKEHGRIRYDDTPLTERWWFWTGLAAVVLGAGGGVAYALWEPEPVVTQDPDVYTLTVLAE